MSEEKILSRAERNRLQLRSDILQAAFIEFSERGYHQTAIADIAQRLGIGHGTFYRHFENKRDILEHVINDTAVQLTNLLAAENAPTAVATLDEYTEQCRRIAERFSEFAHVNPNMLRLVLLEATSIDAEMTQRVFMLIDTGGHLTAAYLNNGVARGYLRSDLDTLSTGHAIVGMIMAGMFRLLSDPTNPNVLKPYAESVVRLIVEGMAN
ncbi:MAG: TetR/AcrR family transcriptional regulator [Moraxellaceae bacterium]|nr:TetR/AcrR family transcriptional regulator [Moraxellaceae bacterium]MDZ4385887.1 TetR/AcrR family transcriptional regulator [Moraxellaceae bacterium]